LAANHQVVLHPRQSSLVAKCLWQGQKRHYR
jgi:hypothetical protein